MVLNTLAVLMLCAGACAATPASAPLTVRMGVHDALCFVVVEQAGRESMFWSNAGCAVFEREVAQPPYHATGEWWRPR